MKKQVFFVFHSLAVGGAERQISAVANYISRQGIEVQILLIDNATVSFAIEPGIGVVCINQGISSLPDGNVAPCTLFLSKKIKHSCLKSCIAGLRLKWYGLIKSKKVSILNEKLYLEHYSVPLRMYLRQFPDAVVVSCMTIPNLVTMMALEGLNNTLIFSDRTSPAFEYPPKSPINALKRQYYPSAQKAVFQTEEARDYYTWLPNVKKYIIPNFIKGEKLPKRFEGTRRREIVTFTRLHPVKNLPMLIDAFKMLVKDFPDYQLSIYGDGFIKNELKEYVQSLNLDQKIIFHDFDTHLHEKIRDCAMYVSSSDREGISNSMLEAMAIGLPVVCTDCPAGGARMMIQPYENGLLVPVRDVNALYSAMKEVIENPPLAEKMSLNAVKIKELLTEDKICEQWLTVVSEI